MARESGESVDPGEDSRWVALHVAGCYVDDSSGVSFDDVYEVAADGTALHRASAHFAIAREALRELGHDSAPRKEQPPGDVRVVLGAEIDMVRCRLRLSDDKRVRYAAMAGVVAGMQTCELAVFRKLVGRLTFASCMYPRARQWLHVCYRVMRARNRMQGGRVCVTCEARTELLLWVAELERPGHEGVPLAHVGRMPECGEPGTAAIYADASGEIGFGAWAVKGRELLVVWGEWTEAERTELIICEKELVASTVGLRTLAPMLVSTSSLTPPWPSVR